MSKSLGKINQRWQDFKKVPFPAVLHEDKYSDLKLELTDMFVAGCISSFLENKGTLRDEKIQVLKEFQSKYPGIDARLVDSACKNYFKELFEITALVLIYTKSPDIKSAKKVLESFKETGRYSQAFLNDLEEGLRDSDYFLNDLSSK